jgi:hypothetical protein
MFDEPFGNGGGDGVVLKNLSPVFEGLVGGQDDRTGVGTFRYDLEEEVPSVFVQRHVAELIDNEQAWGGETF